MPISMLWAPERVGEGRRFRVVVEGTGPVRCEHSPALTLLDRTPEDRVGPEHRFYFRADTPTASAQIVLTSADGAALAVSVPVVAEVDWAVERLQGEIELPRVWPLDRREVGLKERHTLTPADEIGKAASGTAFDPGEWSDDELWNLVVPCDIPRWHFLNLDKGCPIHGLTIYHTDPYYPWLVEPREDAYRVQCPVGEEFLPTNDYAAGDLTGGDYPDDGFGFEEEGENPLKVKYGFLAYSLLRRIRFYYGVVSGLAGHFRATGSQETARKLVLLLVAIAREHRYLCCFPEHRFRRYEGAVEEEQYRERKREVQFGPLETTRVEHLARAGMDDYCINMPGHYKALAAAYDLIFDRIEDDAELADRIGARVPWITSGHEIRRFLETWLLRAGAQGALDNTTDSNLPCPQEALLAVIRALDLPECAELTEWLVRGGGHVARMPSNFYYKDGAAYESVGGYNGIHVSGIIPLAEGLHDLCEQHPELYPADRYDVIAGSSKFYHVLRWPLEIIVAQMTPTLIGDHGDVPKGQILSPTPAMSVGHPINVYRKALEYFPGDAKFAAALRMLEAKADLPAEPNRPGKRTGFYDTPPEADVDFDTELFWPSRLLDGYGVGILESGEGERRRGLWLYYGDHPGHAHVQLMDMGFVASRRNLLRHMGYPYSWQHMGTWDAAWITHYGVHVGGEVNPWWKSTVRTFHGRGAFQIVEAFGHGVSRDRSPEGFVELPGYGIRRALCLVDLPDGRFYGVDLFRVTGGDDQWWTFHGPPGEMSLSCGDSLKTQLTGTVAGAGVEYGAKAPDGTPESLAYLYDVKRSEGIGAWSATWDLPGDDGAKMRVTQVAPQEGELVFARGRSPHAPPENPPYELDWALRHVEGADQDTEYVCLLESDTELPVGDARCLATGAVSHVLVEAGEVVHHILRGDGVTEHECEGVVFRGRAGFVETDRATGALRRMTLVGEGTLTLGGQGISDAAKDWSGTIEGVDVEGLSLLVRSAEKPPEGADLLLAERAFGPRPAGDTFAYRVDGCERIEADLWRFRLVWSPLLGDGAFEAVDGRKITLGGAMPIANSRGYFRGSYLVAPSGRRYRVADVRTGRESTEVLLYDEDADPAGDGLAVGDEVRIVEIAAGDRAVIHGWTQLDLTGEAPVVESAGVNEASVTARA